MIDPGVLLVGCDDSGGDAHQHRQNVGQQSEHGGDGERLLDDLVDGLIFVLGGIAEVGVGMPGPTFRLATVGETNEAAHVAPVLRELGLIEAVLGFEVGLDLRGQAALTAEGAARRHLDHHEGDGEDDEDEWSHDEQSAKGEA